MSIEQRLENAISEFRALVCKHVDEFEGLPDCYEAIESVLCGMSKSFDEPEYRIVRIVSDKHVYLCLQIDSEVVAGGCMNRWITKCRVKFSKRKVEALTMQRRLEENG